LADDTPIDTDAAEQFGGGAGEPADPWAMPVAAMPATEPATESVSGPATEPAAPVSSSGRGPARPWVIAALIGALVGALVSSALIIAFDDESPPVTSPTASELVTRPSDRIARTGDIASILQTAVPAVVAIVDDGGPDAGGAAGTGFVISPDGVIVSNNHVVEGAGSIQAVFSDGTSRPATVLGRNAASDLAVLKVDAKGLPTLALGDSNDVQVGDDVVAIGNALALSGGLSVTRGIISGLHREVPTDAGSVLEDLLQTDAAINPGNSGGPLVDARGRVIGINTAIANPGTAQNVGFAIPISNAMTIIDQLRNGRQPAFLGVRSEDAAAARAAGRPVGVEGGAYITGVEPGTPAERAGLRAGDVVVRVDDRPVESAAQLGNVIRQRRPGDTVTVVVNRDGEEVSVRATLSEGPTS
jgi:putative serine protease PepD